MKSSLLHPLLGAALAVALSPACLHAGVTIIPSAGFTLEWDGNDGDHFSADHPALVPPNPATSGTAFTSSDLGPELDIDFHVASNLNDGIYGNANSWIGGSAPGTPYAAIRLNAAYSLSGFAFGRDNGNNVTDVNGGQLTDRALGRYTIQITRTPVPDAGTLDTGDALTGWQTIGILDYVSDDDALPGGQFTSYFRHQYSISEGGNGVVATGFRILVPGSGLAGGTAIDEIELIGTVVPEPSTAAIALLGAGGLAFRRRRP